jgi:hypothetical protein
MINPKLEILRRIRECHIENNALCDSTPDVEEDDYDRGYDDDDNEEDYDAKR